MEEKREFQNEEQNQIQAPNLSLNDDEQYIETVWQELTSESKEPIFLTGDAGTGKSTLMRKLKDHYEGKCIVVAPTGIAAINIGGQTIHSFFGFPARTVSYKNIKTLMRDCPSEEEIDRNPNLYAAYQKDQDIIACVENSVVCIIDEISMVRADLMDQIAWYFHKNFPGKMFGGLKLIMVGDMDQLPPVIGTEEEDEMIRARFKSPFFIDAKCWTSWMSFKTIRLKKVWRQKDPEFVEFLNAIKNNRLTDFKMQQFCNNVRNNVNAGVIICSTNKSAAEYNRTALDALSGRSFFLDGKITGEFQDKNCPVDKNIEIKIGAKVMIVRNGSNYVNGTIGELTEYDAKEGRIKIKANDGREIYLKPFDFESVEYTYNANEDKIKSRVGGKFTQFPIKLAYAISVHKSQGQTFDEVTIDLGRGAFAHGQAYVALSRCTSIAGTALKQDLRRRDFIYDKRILEFNLTGK